MVTTSLSGRLPGSLHAGSLSAGLFDAGLFDAGLTVTPGSAAAGGSQHVHSPQRVPRPGSVHSLVDPDPDLVIASGAVCAGAGRTALIT